MGAVTTHTNFKCRDCGREVFSVRITRREAYVDIETGDVTYEESGVCDDCEKQAQAEGSVAPFWD